MNEEREDDWEKTIKLLNKNGYLRVKVIPRSNENKIANLMADDTLKIRIKAAPEKGKANEELINFLSKLMKVNKQSVSIISGKADQLKLLKINL